MGGEGEQTGTGGDPGPVALTGATGFLGSHILDALLDGGLPARAVVRDPARLHRQAPHAVASLEDQDALARAFAGCHAVVANAALGSWQGPLQRYLDVNVHGLERCLRAAAQAGVRRIILISTVAVHHTRLGVPVTEDSERYGPRRRWLNASDLTTDWRYALSKSMGEDLAWRLADQLDLQLTALRPSPVYGPRDPKVTVRLRRAAARPLVLAPTVRVPFVHARDVADATVAALQRPQSAGRAFLLAGPPVPLADVLGHLREAGGHRGVLVRLPVPLGVTFDTSAAQEALGFAARDWRQGWGEE